MVAEIRLTWWRESLDEIIAGKPARGHPVLQALQTAVRRNGLTAAPLEAISDASFDDLDRDRFTDEAALERYLDAAGGAVMALAVAITAGADATLLRPAAHAWGLFGLLRRRAAGFDRFPAAWEAEEPGRRIAGAMVQARASIAALPVDAFPAVAHLALIKPSLESRSLPELEKRARLTWAVLRGRV